MHQYAVIAHWPFQRLLLLEEPDSRTPNPLLIRLPIILILNGILLGFPREHNPLGVFTELVQPWGQVARVILILIPRSHQFQLEFHLFLMFSSVVLEVGLSEVFGSVAGVTFVTGEVVVRGHFLQLAPRSAVLSFGLDVF